MMSNDGHAMRMARLRLTTLVGSELGVEPTEFGHAVGVVERGVASVLLTGRHESGLGPALLWAMKQNAKSLRVFSDQQSGDLARRANNFEFDVQVFDAGSSSVNLLQTAQAIKVSRKEVSVADEMFSEMISASGADVVREHGVLAGEVLGLEVCRVVHGQNSESRLEIGVGVHDRETFQLLHGQNATLDSLRSVVKEVSLRRAVTSPAHPLKQLARERLLRHIVCGSPTLVGAKDLQATQPPVVRANLKDVVPCCAIGVLQTGGKVVVTFSVGIDPDVVSFAADARDQINPSAELVIASPTRDIVPSIEKLAKLLKRPARFVGVDVSGL